MAVEDRNPEYLHYESKWLKCRVCAEGEEAVKNAGEVFLPKLVAQTADEYNAYKMRASFFAGTARAIGALVGMLFKKPPRLEGSTEDLDEVLKTATEDKTDLQTFVKHVTEEVVTVGRVCVVVDVAADAPNAVPYLTSYTAVQVIN